MCLKSHINRLLLYIPGVAREVFVEEDVDAALQQRGVVERLRAEVVPTDPRVVPLQWNSLFKFGTFNSQEHFKLCLYLFGHYFNNITYFIISRGISGSLLMNKRLLIGSSLLQHGVVVLALHGVSRYL